MLKRQLKATARPKPCPRAIPITRPDPTHPSDSDDDSATVPPYYPTTWTVTTITRPRTTESRKSRKPVTTDDITQTPVNSSATTGHTPVVNMIPNNPNSVMVSEPFHLQNCIERENSHNIGRRRK